MTATCIDDTTDLILGEETHLRGIARRLARCESDADDLVQETLLRSYRARVSFQPGTSVRAWTSTILRRLFITGMITAKRRRVQTDTDSGGALDAVVGRAWAPCVEPTSGFHGLGEDLDEDVKQALDRVPERFRTSFLMSAVRELSCAEIAHQLRVPAGTVMSRVHRARERLRADLAQHRAGYLAPDAQSPRPAAAAAEKPRAAPSIRVRPTPKVLVTEGVSS